MRPLTFASRIIAMIFVAVPISVGAVDTYESARKSSHFMRENRAVEFNLAANAADTAPQDRVKKSSSLPPQALLPGKPSVSFIVVPSGMEERQFSKKEGCWAKLHDEDSLQGDALTIFGPIQIPEAGGAGVFDIDWVDRISRIVMGPKARLEIYDNTEFRDLVATMKPGQNLNVNKDLNYFDEIKSIRITCENK